MTMLPLVGPAVLLWVVAFLMFVFGNIPGMSLFIGLEFAWLAGLRLGAWLHDRGVR